MVLEVTNFYPLMNDNPVMFVQAPDLPQAIVVPEHPMPSTLEKHFEELPPALVNSQIPITPTIDLPCHPMYTQAQVDVQKPNLKYILHILTLPLVPTRSSLAMQDPDWKDAMLLEYNALLDNHIYMRLGQVISRT